MQFQTIEFESKRIGLIYFKYAPFVCAAYVRLYAGVCVCVLLWFFYVPLMGLDLLDARVKLSD